MTDLAIALERLRQLDEAKTIAHQALARDPSCVPAIGLLGQIAMVQGDHEEAEKWLNRSVAEARAIDARAVGWHRLGALRELQHRWDEAFQCHDRANRAMLSTPAARHMLATPIFEHLPHQFLDGCEATLARWAVHRFADALPDPVILCGFPRSGTTMTENVLAALPGTITSDEEPVLAGAALLATELSGNPAAADTMAALDALTDDHLTRLRSEYWKSACRLVSPEAMRADLFVDKTPLRFAHALLLNRIFPRSRMIFVVRDPRDCCLSCFFQDFAVSPTLVKFLTLETTGDLYAQVMAFWMRARTRVTMPVLEVRYEDMVADFEAHARRLVEFVGRPWSDEVLRFHEKASGRSIRTPSYRAVTERVNTRAVGKWAKYEKHLGPLLDRVRPFLEPLGYEE